MMTNIASNGQLHSYQQKVVNINLIGNGNQILLQNCSYTIKLTGNGNKVMIVDNSKSSISKGVNLFSITGNGNYVGFGGGELKIQLYGNGNQIQGQSNGLTITSNNGLGNLYPKHSFQNKISPSNNSIVNNQKNVNFNKLNIFEMNNSSNNLFNKLNNNNNKNFYIPANYKSGNQQSNKLDYCSPKIKNINKLNQRQQFGNQKQQQQSFNKYLLNNHNQYLISKNNIRNFHHSPNSFCNRNSRSQKSISINNLNININNNYNDNLKRNNQRLQHQNLLPPRQLVQTIQSQDSVPLNQFEINRLSKSKHYGKTINCHICLEDIQKNQQEIYLLCFHSYHSKCILGWFKKSSKCPFCFCDVRKQIKQTEKYY